MPRIQYTQPTEKFITLLTACIGARRKEEVVVEEEVLVRNDAPYRLDARNADWMRFQSLVEEWKRTRGAMSSITDMSMLPAYQNIIGLGLAALPMILAQLKAEGDDPDQWFWALMTIAEANGLALPQIRPEDQGNYRRMAKTWLRWGEEQGYAW